MDKLRQVMGDEHDKEDDRQSDKNKNNDKVVHFQEPGGGEDPDKNRQEPKDSEDDDLDWYVQMQETSMRNELLLETVNRNTNDMQKILKGLLQAVHSTHELNKNMVEQQSKMNSNLNTLATSIQSLSITFRGEKARQRQYREKLDMKSDPNSEKCAPVAQLAMPAPDGELRCHRCTKPGYWSNECPLKDWGLFFCYVCNDVKRHKSDNCPNRVQQF